MFSSEFQVTAIGNSHQAKLRTELESLGFPNKGQSFSFKIETKGKSILYSAVLGSFEDIRDHLDGVEFAMVETTHVDIGEILDHARQSDVGAYVLTHLGSKEEVALLRQRITESGMKSMLIADDGLRLEL